MHPFVLYEFSLQPAHISPPAYPPCPPPVLPGPTWPAPISCLRHCCMVGASGASFLRERGVSTARKLHHHCLYAVSLWEAHNSCVGGAWERCHCCVEGASGASLLRERGVGGASLLRERGVSAARELHHRCRYAAQEERHSCVGGRGRGVIAAWEGRQGRQHWGIFFC